MGDIILVIITALISGLLATLITIYWQKKSEKRKQQLKVFEVLMAYRYMIHAEESVKAINSIDVVFYDNKDVRKALEAFINETAKKSEFNPNVGDKYLKLLEEMAKALKLEDIHWDNIKQSYYPNGLAQKIQDEDVLRKIQIQNAIDTAKKNEESQNTPSDNQFGEQIMAQILPDLIKNPDSFAKLIELGEKFSDTAN